VMVRIGKKIDLINSAYGKNLKIPYNFRTIRPMSLEEGVTVSHARPSV
jgi:hypothetical protein